MRRNILFLLLGVLIMSSATAQSNLPANMYMKKLDNGLDVLVIEDHSVPLVTIEINVKNGAYTETPEYDGLSHLYEHMFFKANKDYPSQEKYMERVRELGVSFNGTTSTERVNYFITLGSHNLKPGLEFMNSAIRYPKFDTVEMRAENSVVAGEFKRNESNPIFFLRDEMAHQLWGDLYSRKNTIGDYNIIETATAEKMEVIKGKYYHPNNSLLMFAGDVDHEECFKLAEEIMGEWEPCDFDPFEKWPIPEIKPLEKSTKFIVENEVSTTPVIMYGYHGPDTRNDVKATYAADVFSFILSQRTSKFHQTMIESGLALNTNVSYYTQRYTGPINIFLVPNPNKIQEAMDALAAEIEKWDDDDYFTDEQLQTAKNLLAISDDYSKEQTSQFVHTVGFWWAVADIDYYVNYVEELQKVTREDIKNYVRTYIQGKPHACGMLISPQLKEALGVEEFFTQNQ